MTPTGLTTLSKKAPKELPLRRGQLRKREVSDEELLAFFRGCSCAKVFRAGAMHYTRTRKKFGKETPVTNDAELNAYKQALAFVEEVQRKMRRAWE